MKHNKLKGTNVLVIGITFLITLNIIMAKSLRTNNKATCSISTISIPIGSSSPVMIYNARIENEDLRLTVLNKEQTNNYKVDGNLFFTDKESGEAWYADKNVDNKRFESMRGAFSLCRTLNVDNRVTKDLESNHSYDQYRTARLPENVSLRVVDNNSATNSLTTSFLQIKMTTKLTQGALDSALADRNLERELDELDQDQETDLVAERYDKLNNEAYIQNKELEKEIKNNEKNNEADDNHPTNDLYLD